MPSQSGGAGLRPLMSGAAVLLTNGLPTTNLAADMTVSWHGTGSDERRSCYRYLLDPCM